MIVRIWEGQTSNENSELYTKIIEDRDIPGYKSASGFLKLTFLKRSDNEITYFKLLTFWSDLDHIAKFAGTDKEEAKYYDEDEQYVLNFPGSVSHFTVFSEK